MGEANMLAILLGNWGCRTSIEPLIMFAGVINESSMDREKCGRAGSPCDGEGTNSQRFVCFHRHRKDKPYLLEGRVSMLDVAWVPLNGESKTMQFNLPLPPPEL